MLTRRHIEELNARPQKKGGSVPPLLAGGTALGAAVLFAVGFLLLDSPLIGAALACAALLGGGAVILARGRSAGGKAMELRYGLMDGATSARFARMGKAFALLVASEKIWRVQKLEDGDAVERPVAVRIEDPPGVRTDVEVWSIEAGPTRAYFLPEAVLVLEDEQYRAISYQALGVDLAAERVVEEGEVPGDAEVVGSTWRYVDEEGTGPDPTKSFNPRLPVVHYGLMRLRASGWDGMDVWVSNQAAAAQVVLAFLATRPDPERVERWQGGIRPTGERGKGDPAYAVLGLRDGAPKGEITAAYRRIARAYHPDRTAKFVPEFRALANRRMQEINAAYSRLRRETG